MTRHCLYSLLAAATCVCFVGDVHANSSNSSSPPPEQIIGDRIDAVLEFLRDPSLQGADKRAERHRKLRAVAGEIFDWAEMARRSLGVHWRPGRCADVVSERNAQRCPSKPESHMRPTQGEACHSAQHPWHTLVSIRDDARTRYVDRVGRRFGQAVWRGDRC